MQAPASLYVDRSYRPAKFPTRNISTPIVLLYGDQDSLVDIGTMMAALPEHAIAKPVRPFRFYLDYLLTQNAGSWA